MNLTTRSSNPNKLLPFALLLLLAGSLTLAGCGGSGSTTGKALGDTCISRASDGLQACTVARVIDVSISRPAVLALDLVVGGVVILPAIPNGGGYYESVNPEWAPSFNGGPAGEWLIYDWVLRQSKDTAIVRGYNTTTKAEWSALFSISGGRAISGGRVYYDHLEHGDTTHWSVKLDGTDHRKEL